MTASQCPEGMSPAQWQRSLRRQAAASGQFAVSELSDRWSPGQYTVTSPHSRRTYRTVYHGDNCDRNYCECMDFRTGNLGTCKHIEAVALWLQSHGKEPVTAQPRRSSIYMSYIGGRKLKLRPGTDASEEMAIAAMRYFDDDLTAVPGMIPELPAFIENARRIDPQFHCYPDALNYILEARDRRRRLQVLESIDNAEIGAVLHTSLYPYQTEGIRFIFTTRRRNGTRQDRTGPRSRRTHETPQYNKLGHDSVPHFAQIPVEERNRTFHRIFCNCCGRSGERKARAVLRAHIL